MLRPYSEYVETKETLPLRERDHILTTLGKLSMPKDEYFVLGGANMVLRGIKYYTPDVDVLVSNNLFGRLRRVKDAVIKQPPDSAVRRGATNTTVWINTWETPIPLSATTGLGDGCYPMTFESHKDRVEMVDGIPCSVLDDVIAAKSSLQRKKDFVDLQRISNFLGTAIEVNQPPIIGPLHFS
jgi:hypothetical protein